MIIQLLGQHGLKHYLTFTHERQEVFQEGIVARNLRVQLVVEVVLYLLSRQILRQPNQRLVHADELELATCHFLSLQLRNVRFEALGSIKHQRHEAVRLVV